MYRSQTVQRARAARFKTKRISQKKKVVKMSKGLRRATAREKKNFERLIKQAELAMFRKKKI